MKYEKVELISPGSSSGRPKPPSVRVVLSILEASSSKPKPPPVRVELSSPVASSSRPKPPSVRVGLSIPEASSSRPKPPPAKVELGSPVASSSKPKSTSATVGLSIPEASSSKPERPPAKVELGSPVASSSKPELLPEKLSPMALATLKVVKERAERSVNRRTPDIGVKYFDNTDARYNWLLPGWIAEEHFVPTGRKGVGRIYKYYYDPTGTMYYTKSEVFFAWRKANIIYID